MKYHYTYGRRLPEILREGVIRLATAGVRRPEEHAVWFSANPDWERTVIKGSRYDFDRNLYTRAEIASDWDGVFRIVVADETAPHDWNAYVSLSGIDPRIAKGLYRHTLFLGGKPGEHFVSFDPVPESKWLAIEEWRGAWVPYDTAAMVAA